MKYKKIYFLTSLVILLPGLASLLLFGLKLSIDFTGGSVMEFEFQEKVKDSVRKEDLNKLLSDKGVQVDSIVESGDKRYIVKTTPVDNAKNDELKSAVSEKYNGSSQISFETVGPAIGREAAKNAFLAVGLACIGILLFIAYSFREIPKPYSSFRFGVSTITALLHDVLVVVGIFSILGKVLNVEINALFITALLTVLGFSVHDTIVVFDRIRENLSRMRGQAFETVVNFSLVETLNRSLKTSLTVILTLFAMLLLGGETIKWFVFALLIGIVSGTYSSIFNAAPLLVVWEQWSSKRKR